MSCHLKVRAARPGLTATAASVGITDPRTAPHRSPTCIGASKGKRLRAAVAGIVTGTALILAAGTGAAVLCLWAAGVLS